MNDFLREYATGFTYFMMATLVSSIIMLLILMVKRGLKKHIAARWQYYMDLLFLVLLIIPLMPANLLSFFDIGNALLSGLQFEPARAASTNAVAEGGAEVANGLNWLQDFTVSVDRVSTSYIVSAFMLMWLIGIVALVIFTFFCNRKLQLVKESMKPIKTGEMAVLFDRCKAELGINKNIILGTSVIVKSPTTIGLFKMRIILPVDIRQTLSLEDIRYILLHELTHCKNRDILVNNVMCGLQILYWFNPLIYVVFKKMRLDREIACDSSVLKRLPKEHHIDYGKTLLNFAVKLSRSKALYFAAEIGGSKRQIIKRIESIASFVKEAKRLRVKSACIFSLMGLLILILTPTISALASYDDTNYQFQNENIVDEDLSSFFEEFTGSFVLYDMEADKYTIYNRDQSVKRVSPDSTYKIYSALIALETGIIERHNSGRSWDGTAYPYEVWNKDQELLSAMQNSVTWYFQNLDAQVGMKELTSYFTQLSYGNHDLSGGIMEYWMESSLRISPMEQVELLKDFYLNKTIFKSEHVDMVKGTLRLSEKGDAVLSGKTGTGSVNGKTVNGWFIGYVENRGHTYIFATNIQGEDNAGGSAAAQITYAILNEKGIYK